jgi:hypothetical protein
MYLYPLGTGWPSGYGAGILTRFCKGGQSQSQSQSQSYITTDNQSVTLRIVRGDEKGTQSLGV